MEWVLVGVRLGLAALLAGSLVYCVLVVVAAWRYLGVKPPAAGQKLPLSVLKPLAGSEPDLYENLRSFFRQTHRPYELIFAVRRREDPAVGVVERLMAEFPGQPARLLITGDPPYANAKVFALDHMVREARHDLLVMSDSDIRVGPDFLQVVEAEFQDPAVGLATCPYRAVPGGSFWALLEAVGINTEFMAGILVARMVEGMHFALGPTIVARRQVLAAVGGFDALKEYLAEDFVLGQRAAASGSTVILSSYVIEHHIGGEPLGPNFRHRLRWNRSTRRSRPAGYVGQVFTNPLPVALLLWLAAPSAWPVVVVTAALRAAAAGVVAGAVLHDPLSRRYWYLIPFQDLVSFLFWVTGFFGSTILWRGRRYRLLKDGRFELVADSSG